MRGAMYTDWQDPTSTATARNEQIAAMHREHARQLERRVERRARASPETIEDACSFAWLQLLTHTCIDLDAPNWRALGWLTQSATREAWRLEARRRRDGLLDHVALEGELGLREQIAHGADEVVAQRERLALVAQIPERPRRFLLRLALGYGYRDIAVEESVSLRTSHNQIARAKRLLRAADTSQPLASATT
ncbi:MAG: RNA polymerase sigma factor [Solirubrobacteraceae bacterium]